MAILQTKSNNSFSINTTIRESDEYTESVYVKFEMDPIIGVTKRVDEMFVTPDELEELGLFMIEQAKIIRYMQLVRKSVKTSTENSV